MKKENWYRDNAGDQEMVFGWYGTQDSSRTVEL